MKKALLIFCLLISSTFVFSHAPKNDFDYSIVFGGCFDKDIVSLKINNKSIFKSYKVENRDSVIKGNLSLIQSNKSVNINFNGNQKVASKINFSFILQIEITVNSQLNKFKVDLRKGKILLIEFCPGKNAASTVKKLTIDQFQEPFLFI